ncbi:hypothetical protein GCM10010129_78810 [Streptomyces fumigatiscleroticus]|nr:hypothetical protein GCM10010129_78810 [Streptomyces fumigatiscleroticus]
MSPSPSFGYPVAEGHLPSGGQTSDFTALPAAREQALPGAREHGVAGRRATVHCSDEAHHSVVRTLASRSPRGTNASPAPCRPTAGVFLAPAVVDGRTCLRVCFVNFRTTPDLVKTVLETADELGRGLTR